MSDEWRNDAATEKQKEKLHFFNCTWNEGITKGQASDAIDECVKKFPNWEFMYQNRPATEEQKGLLRKYGKRPLRTITYARARDIIKQCERYGWKINIPKQNEEHFETHHPISKGRRAWIILLSIFRISAKVLGFLLMIILWVFVVLISGFSKTRRR
jgi:hypothetical protein